MYYKYFQPRFQKGRGKIIFPLLCCRANSQIKSVQTRYLCVYGMWNATALTDVYEEYEFYEKSKFIEDICDFEYKKLFIPEPDQVLFLTAPFDLITSLKSFIL